MANAEMILAMILLTSPPKSPLPDLPDDNWPALQAALVSVGTELEILDPRESSLMLRRQEELEGDVEILRRRYLTLRDAPKLADARRLPSRKLICQMVSANRDAYRHLGQLATVETDRAESYKQGMAEANHLYDIWDAARDATCEYYFVNVRREAMLRLREELGADRFGAGWMPPPLPSFVRPVSVAAR